MAKGGGRKNKARRADGVSAAKATIPAKPPTSPKASKPPKIKAAKSKVVKAVKGAKTAAGKLSDNPLVAEVVAAALVATAAALRNPKKARRMASDAAGELEGALKAGGQKTSAFWQLARDVARRSIETLESDAGKTRALKKRKP